MKKAFLLLVAVLAAAILLPSCDDSPGGVNKPPAVDFYEALGVSAVAGTAADASVTPAVATGWKRYEAENGKIENYDTENTNSRVNGVETQSVYSGGKGAGGLNKPNVKLAEVLPSWGNIGHVKFNVDVKTAGNHRMKIYQNGNDNKQIYVRLNDKQVLMQLPRQEGAYQWDTVFAWQIALGPFKAGKNDLWVSGTIDIVLPQDPGQEGWANIDCIDIEDAVYTE